mgnify:CR=1 FL=1
MSWKLCGVKCARRLFAPGGPTMSGRSAANAALTRILVGMHDYGTGLDLAQRGIHNLKSTGSFARMPYWLSLLADLA